MIQITKRQSMVKKCFSLLYSILKAVSFANICYQAATSLQRRPILHASSLLLSVTFSVWIILKIIPGLSIAWGSHHIRDAQRRGLWFPPLGSTPAIPYLLYLLLEFMLPIFVKLSITTGVRDSSEIEYSELRHDLQSV